MPDDRPLDWLSEAGRRSRFRLKMMEIAMNSPAPVSVDVKFLSMDDMGELLMYAMPIGAMASPEQAADLYKAVDRIIADKMKEVVHLIDKQKRTNPMNGDGSNNALRDAKKAIMREFHLEESE